MSVVNKMLQDLEKRKKRAWVSADYVANDRARSNANSKAVFEPWMLALSVCAISAAILLSQIDWRDEPQQMLYAQQLPPSYLPAANQADLNQTNQNQTNQNQAHIIHADVNQEAVAAAVTHEPIPASVQSQGLAQNMPAETAEAQVTHTPRNPIEQAVQSTLAMNPSSNAEKAINVETAETAISERNAAIEQIAISAPIQPALGRAPMISPALAKVDTAPAASGDFSVAPSSGATFAISSLREQARIAINNDDIRGAVTALETLVAAYPEDVRARKQLASLLFSHHSVERAYVVLTEGLLITPADSAMRLMLARVAFKTGSYQDAHNALMQHPYPAIADIEYISFRAALAERLSQYENAYQDYTLLVAREPNNAKWWLGLGVSQDKLKRAKQALESYRQARDLNQLPTSVDTFVDERIAALVRQS